MKKDEKNRKKSLTKGERCGNIVKLSQRDGAKKAAESRPIEGKELAEGKRRSEAGTKKSWKKMKKVLDKANSMWYDNMAVAKAERVKNEKDFEKILKSTWQSEADVIE